MSYDLIGVGNALLDFQIEVPESVLEELQIKKASMSLVEAPYQLKLLAELHQKLGKQSFVTSPGGSAANTLAGFARMGGKSALVAKVGSDDNGQLYASETQKSGVEFFSKPGGQADTGTCLALITPDAERTMLTCLGISIQLDESDISEEKIEKAKILFLEGYMWDTPTGKAASLKAAKIAKQKGLRVALTLSDSFCVGRHHEEFVSFVKNDVDILFANELEAQAITKTQELAPAFEDLKTWADQVFVSIGPKGALASEESGRTSLQVPTWDVPVKDKIGAGDLFASGVLFGLLRKKSLQESAYLGCYAATRVIQQMSARIEEDLSGRVNEALQGPGRQAVA